MNAHDMSIPAIQRKHNSDSEGEDDDSGDDADDHDEIVVWRKSPVVVPGGTNRSSTHGGLQVKVYKGKDLG